MELRATAVERAALGPDDIDRMFSLYAASYCDTVRAQFDRDPRHRRCRHAAPDRRARAARVSSRDRARGTARAARTRPNA